MLRLLRSTRGLAIQARRALSAIPQPVPSNETKDYPDKIVQIVDNISKLTLIEVSDLNELLKKRLNIPDVPMMTAGAMPMMPSASQSADADEEDAASSSKVQTQFTVKLMKFDEPKKIQLIKELKNLMDGFNLVQAKKFVESAPQVVKKDITKEEAENLKKAIEAAGGVCEIS